MLNFIIINIKYIKITFINKINICIKYKSIYINFIDIIVNLRVN